MTEAVKYILFKLLRLTADNLEQNKYDCSANSGFYKKKMIL